MTARTAIGVRPAVGADVPELDAVFAAAFATDRHTQAKTALGASMSMVGALRGWLADPDRCAILVAEEIRPHHGARTLGWCCWSRRGYPDQPPPQSIPDSSPTASTADTARPPPSPLAALESLTSRDLRHQLDRLVPAGTRARILTVIAVAPAFQRRGAGAALIRWGTDRADADGVLCWVHASEAGYSAFARHGFVERSRLDVDLDHYAPVSPARGIYTFRCLTRPPRP